MLRVNEDDLELTPAHLFTWEGEPFTGIGYETRKDGSIISEISYVDGVQEGTAREWYPSGQLRAEEEFKRGGRHGLSRHYDEQGRLRSKAVYEFTTLVRRREWDENGVVTLDYHIDPEGPAYARLQQYRKEEHE